MFELNDFSSIKIGVASPQRIRELSRGEVTKSETVNYRTQKPEKDGLFCEKIFGPTKDNTCHCGRYKKAHHKGIICEKCGVEVTSSKVRRDRMGHIELAAPVSHIWYHRGSSTPIALILDLRQRDLEDVIYYAKYIVIKDGSKEGDIEKRCINRHDKNGNVIREEIKVKSILNDNELREFREEYGYESTTGCKFGMGAEAIQELLQAIDLKSEIEEVKAIIDGKQSSAIKEKAGKRLRVLEAFDRSENRPEWMILNVIPVLPPDLRPMVQLDGGRFASSDLNELYRKVITRNNRLKALYEKSAPESMIKNEKRMLQELVDALIDNGKKGKALQGASGREYKSLSNMLRGKQGRFRQNLLGKRVDYSGRSVIVVGPELKLYQCGIPKEMAIELFKPFVIHKLVDNGSCTSPNTAKNAIERGEAKVWDALEEVIKDHPVLLNRAPTLHRLSIQAFEPVLIEGRAIKIHPLVCTAFNADFDGDQMAVHVPISLEAQSEARLLMLSSNNILKLSDGKPVLQPSQDMVMGAYYLTILRREDGKYYTYDGVAYHECDKETEGAELYKAKYYISEDEALMAYQTIENDERLLHIQDEIFVRRTVKIDDEKSIYYGETVTGLEKTTVGRIIFNQEMPQDLGFVKRINKEDYLKYEISYDFLGKAVAVGKKQLGSIVDRCFKTGGATRASEILDKIKALGYKYSTVGAITTSVFDMHIPKEKKSLLAETEQKVEQIERKYNRGLLREEERYTAVITAWDATTEHVTNALKKSLDKFNPIWMMANSGARGSIDQMKQLSGMRGLMVNPEGKKIEVPVKSCFRQGLSVLEYFISSHGGRKGLADTALKTADSGYLTRRLVDVSQDVIVREEDCMRGKKPRGIVIKPIMGNDGEIIESLHDRIQGRFLADNVFDKKTGELIAKTGDYVSDELAKEIASKVDAVSIRSIFTCQSRLGVCAKCYGKNIATNQPVQIGEAVGVIAAQSIGEPGTQLTMRTFHTGGISATGDITQGLPRVEELFEARPPRGRATVTECSGRVSVTRENGGDVNSKEGRIIVTVTPNQGDEKKYELPYNAELKVHTGDYIEAGEPLNLGPLNPNDILRIKGHSEVQDYILQQVQLVYRSQGVDINDKHVEIIVRQMLRKVLIQKGGTTGLLPGETYDMFTVEDLNAREIEKEDGEPALQKRLLLGVTKAALSTDSFLSAASFQETTRALTDAAIKNKIDPLVGLKENVIMGKLIPAGTGVKEYNNVTPYMMPNYKEEEDY